MRDSRQTTGGTLFLLALIVLVGAYLRVVNLRTAPGWYPDEGSDLNIALNLAQGRFQYFAVDGTLLVAARAPLYHLICAALFEIFGYDILVARAVAAFAGLMTIPLLFFVFKNSLGRWQALAIAACFAIFPSAVLYNRWAFAYNLLMPFFTLFFWALLRLIETRRARWLLLAASVTALAILTTWVAVALVICLGVTGWFYQRRGLLWSLPLALSLPILFLIVSYLAAPASFMQDFALTFSRTESSLLAQFVMASFNYTVFLGSNAWMIPSIIGLFLIEPRRVRALVLLIFFTMLFFVLRFSVIADLGFYRVLGLVPFMALGIVALLWRAVPRLAQIIAADAEILFARWTWLSQRTRIIRISKLLGVSIFIWLAIVDALFFAGVTVFLRTPIAAPTPIDAVLAVPLPDALAAIDFVNARARPEDVIIASPQIGWALRGRVADFQQTLSYQGFPTDNYPTPLEPARFVFDPTPANARYAVVDPMWEIWATEKITATTQLLNAVAQWDVAFRAGHFTVYRNPAR
ncbi:MAG: glycosyltransferase family 39 protein [Chloroflexi bacterium]|nr:glycosyltransferase family 39 protein [Chloroflexota bacterium]